MPGGPSGTYIENFPAVQPISFDGAQHVIVDSLPSTGGSLVDVSDRTARLLGHVNIDNASLSVTGTFWQATQPVSGTFWQATQPVSLAINTPDITDRAARLLGHVNIDNASLAVTGTFWQASQPVTGIFWQATQPVSLATNTPDVTDRAARLLGHVTVDNASLSVTGTFFQATQPVSGTFWQATQPVSLATNTPDVTDRAARLLGHVTVDNASLTVTGTFFQATQPISVASLPLPTGAALDATLTGNNARARITDGTNLAAVKAASTQAVATDPALVVSMSPNMGPNANNILPSAAASINATVVKASPGRLYKIKGYNAAAAVRYLKFWNKATTPAPASDAALIVFSYPLKASDQFDIDLTPVGFAFSTGIGYTISTGSANTDVAAVTAADIVGLNVMYA